MKHKIMILVSFMLIFVVSLHAKTAQISYTAGLVANIGFTNENVGENDFLKPVEIDPNDKIVFAVGENFDRLIAPSFRIYYQIFCPYGISIYADIEPLSATGLTPIPWKDSAGTISGSKTENGYLIYSDVAKSGLTPRSNSKMISPVVTEVDNISWSDGVEYKSTIKLKVVVQ